MWRFYFMMAIVVGAFYIGIPWLAILSAPVLISALAGYSFTEKKKTETKEIKETRHENFGNYSPQI